MGAHDIKVELDGEDHIFAFKGSSPTGEGSSHIGHIFTTVDKLTPSGASLLEYAARQIKGITGVYGPVGQNGREIRVEYADHVESETARKRLCLQLIAKFGEVCQVHKRAGGDSITCTRIGYEHIARTIFDEASSPRMGSTR